MNARETLRRYLEQRREAGETELVLDGLSVEDALKLLGVPADAPTPKSAIGERIAPGRESSGAPVDWRSALRGAGAEDASRERISSASQPQSMAPPTPAPPIGGGRYGFDAPSDPDPGTSAKGNPPPPLPDLQTGIVVGGGGRELFAGPESPFTSLDEIAKAVASCRLCPLAREAKNPVPGVGNPNAGLVCVGEAPGATEDEMGLPFVGQAGQLLTKILAAINLAREDVFICNVLKHRPPGNRNPLPNEVEACSPYLVRQIELIRPKVIVAFGTFAAQTLLNTKEAIGKLRGKVHRYYGVPLVVTYHPAALLRNPAWKRPTWEDVQLARRLLDRAGGDQ